MSFVNDVIPALTRAGCNQGACHGAAAGKNGFKLSLRGFAPDLDYVAITRQANGRRICKAAPEQSLLLRKPLLEVPHRGGRALRPDGPEYRILASWLAAGAPGPDSRDPHVVCLEVLPSSRNLPPRATLNLRVRARFSDGSIRDVTHWSRFGTNDENVAIAQPDGVVNMTGEGETSITVGYQDKVAFARLAVPYRTTDDRRRTTDDGRWTMDDGPPTAVHRPSSVVARSAGYVDTLIAAKLDELHLVPSAPATDLELVRRLYLDLTGTLPSAEAVRAFAADRGPNKRETLVDSLMASPQFVDYWTYKWCDLFRVNRGTLKDKGMWAFYGYIHESVRENKPWDQLAREVLTATGNTFLDGPANYFRTALKPEELAENVSQGFMGIRVQCAKCHNHPLERWTQNDYYGMANLFARVSRKANFDVWVNDEMTVCDLGTGDVEQPRLGRPVPPKPLGGPAMSLESQADRRAFFADWLTRPDNRYFSSAIVNRVWAHFMGRGLVEPVDDLRETNPPTNAPLLDALAVDFVHHHFDLRYLMRRIVLSAAYSRSSSPRPGNAKDDRYYSRYLVRRLTAEELLDAVGQVTGAPEEFPGVPRGYRAIQLPDTHVKSEFMDSFGRPARQITCECERSQEPSMSQALLFLNSDTINKKVAAAGGLVDRLIKQGRPDRDILDTLYWTALGRPPSAAERAANLSRLSKAIAAADSKIENPKSKIRNDSRRHAFEDMLWALLNSKEFLFNH